MSKRGIKYTQGEIGKVKVVEDFLPSPDELVLREENVKDHSVAQPQKCRVFRTRVPYQRMIRALVDAYADKAHRQ